MDCQLLEKILGSFTRLQAIKSNVCTKVISRNSLELLEYIEIITPADSN